MSKEFTRTKMEDIFIKFLNHPTVYFNEKELILWGVFDKSNISRNNIIIFDKDGHPQVHGMTRGQIVEYIVKGKFKEISWMDIVKWKIGKVE